MHLESPAVPLGKSQEEAFAYLSDLSNFERLMPDTIQTFELLDPDTFRFALKGMPEIVLKRKEETPPERIVLGAASDKLPFTLTADIRDLGSGKSEVQLTFQGQFNAMMAMMVKGPITNFLGTLSSNLSKS
ncbi:SRPBCC family protein [Robiginitalea sp. SC105]|uniref:SRPBCC family protein n=1 Tax=Robiginitalea sp. SC105 TaxID=2762332 RepID=UPI0016395223|nr:SRPBCC family protein [Robiginitalea sp. SC105]MBC2839098.1 SRPBCC family protein [Robiginitalea sp. SC105]